MSDPRGIISTPRVDGTKVLGPAALRPVGQQTEREREEARQRQARRRRDQARLRAAAARANEADDGPHIDLTA